MISKAALRRAESRTAVSRSAVPSVILMTQDAPGDLRRYCEADLRSRRREACCTKATPDKVASGRLNMDHHLE